MPPRADGSSVKLTALLLLLLLASLRGGGTEAKNAAKLGSILKFTYALPIPSRVSRVVAI